METLIGLSPVLLLDVSYAWAKLSVCFTAVGGFDVHLPTQGVCKEFLLIN